MKALADAGTRLIPKDTTKLVAPGKLITPLRYGRLGGEKLHNHGLEQST